MPDDKSKFAGARDSTDEPFFREWKRRTAGATRSLPRAERIAAALGLDQISLPVLTVVGSKGKATTAVYASAALTAAGLRVGAITSPPILSNRERIRLDGQGVSPESYLNISKRLSRLLDEIPAQAQEIGYLSPSGLYTLSGLRHFLDQSCDVAVLEAGMGGSSDEVSIFPPTLVAVTSIFGEHLNVLGPDVALVARDKIGVVKDSTKTVLTLPQTSDVTEVLLDEIKKYDCNLTVIEPQATDVSHERRLPAGLSLYNAALGIEAGQRFLKLLGITAPNSSQLRQVLSTVKTPGRLSMHQDKDGRSWIVDAAINGRGIATALEWATAQFGEIDTVLISLPTGKDVTGAREALGVRFYVPVSLETEHLSFDDEEWGTPLISFQEIERHLKGKRILALGTWSFAGAILKRLGVSYEKAYG